MRERLWLWLGVAWLWAFLAALWTVNWCVAWSLADLRWRRIEAQRLRIAELEAGLADLEAGLAELEAVLAYVGSLKAEELRAMSEPPQIVRESGSAYGGSVVEGCGRCLLDERDAKVRDMLTRRTAAFEFLDRYGEACSLQASSLATEDAIWLGVTDPSVKTLVPGRGWQDVPLPDDVLISSRMHLTRAMVAALIPRLARFVETGELPR